MFYTTDFYLCREGLNDMYNVIRKQLDTEIQLRKVKYNYMWRMKNRKHRNRYGIDNVKKKL